MNNQEKQLSDPFNELVNEFVKENTKKDPKYGLEKAEELSRIAPIYYYGGHGSDFCDPQTKEMVKEIVPDDCIYVTIAVCGTSTIGVNHHLDLMTGNDAYTFMALKFPYQLSFRKIIAKKLGLNVDDIHVHLPGSEYVVSAFETLGMSRNDDYVSFYISGLSEIEKMKENKEKLYLSADKVIEREKTRPKYISEKVIPNLYSASVFPTINQYSEIFKEVMGGDIHGGRIRVEKFLEKKNQISVKIDEISQDDKEAENPYPFLSNTYLMNKFPGIHYWLICRNVPKECENAAFARRSESENQKKTLNSAQNNSATKRKNRKVHRKNRRNRKTRKA